MNKLLGIGGLICALVGVYLVLGLPSTLIALGVFTMWLADNLGKRFKL